MSEGFTFLLDGAFFGLFGFFYKNPLILLEMPPKRSVCKEKGFFWGWAGGAAFALTLCSEVDLLLMLIMWKAALVNPWFLFGH